MKSPAAPISSSIAALIIAVLIPGSVLSQSGRTVKVGILLEDVDPFLPKVIDRAFHLLNEDRSKGAKPRVELKTLTVSQNDSFTASEKVCNLLEKEGAAVILGSESLKVSFHLDSMSMARFIPYVKFLPDFYSNPSRQSVNVVPFPGDIGMAIADYIWDRKWYRDFVLVYENIEALFRLQDVLKIHDSTVKTIQLDSKGDYKPQLKYIKSEGMSKILLDCSIEKTADFLKQAKEVNMITDGFDYFLVNLDWYALDLSEYSNTIVNISGFRIVNPDYPEFQAFQRELRSVYDEHTRSIIPFGIKTEHAFIYDALLIVMKTIDRLYERRQYSFIYNPSLSCTRSRTITMHRNDFIGTLHGISEKGLTGLIKFNEERTRTDFNLTLLRLKADTNRNNGVKEKVISPIAFWNDVHGLHDLYSESEMQQYTEDSLINKTVRITTIFTTPFIMLKENHEELIGNDKYYGYAVDMAEALGKAENFIPVITPVADKKYGDNNTGKWNGMVGELIYQVADAAIADLTITRLRQEAVDFTTPFMNLGIGILFKKSIKTPPGVFSFLDPFKSAVWICMGTAYLGVSILLFVLARLTPAEWDNPHPCDSEPEELENQFNLLNCLWFSMGSLLQQGCDFLPKISPSEWSNPHPCNPDPEELENTFQPLNSFWFTIGSLMQQGSDLAPKSIANRLIAAVWWFFTLIMISSYTANLAAFLTSSMMQSPIKNVEDLANQQKIKYGCVQGGSTQNFFRTSSSEIYQGMWKTMVEAEPSVFTEGNDEGIDRVTKGDYAFFMESMTIKYKTERRCDLMQVGNNLDNKGYGVATRKGSPWRNKMNKGVLRLQEDGTLLRLQKKWWDRPPEEGKCDDDVPKNPIDEQKLGIGNVGGVFVLLMGGMGLACIVGIIEFLWNTQKMSIEENNTFKEQMKKELKFVLNCKNSTKPVFKAPSEALIPGIRLDVYNNYNDTPRDM